MANYDALEKPPVSNAEGGQEEVERRPEAREQEQNKESRDDQKLADMDKRHAHAKALQSLAERSRAVAGRDHENVEKIRADLGLAGEARTPDNATALASDVLEQQAEKEMAELKRKEAEYLDAPEGGSAEPESVDRNVAPEETEIQAIEEENQEQAVEMRQEAMDEWVKNSLVGMLKHFEQACAEAKNGDRATKLMEGKLRRALEDRVEHYVKTGEGVEELAFVVKMQRTKIEKEDGSTDRYVSGIDIEVGSHVLVKYAELFESRNKLMNQDEEESVEQGKEKGAATEEVIK